MDRRGVSGWLSRNTSADTSSLIPATRIGCRTAFCPTNAFRWLWREHSRRVDRPNRLKQRVLFQTAPWVYSPPPPRPPTRHFFFASGSRAWKWADGFLQIFGGFHYQRLGRWLLFPRNQSMWQSNTHVPAGGDPSSRRSLFPRRRRNSQELDKGGTINRV